MPKGLLILAGPKGGGGDDIGSPDGLDSKPASKRSAPPAEEEAEGEDEGGSKGIRPEDVDYSDNDLCESCKYMSGDMCSRYGFKNSATGHCEAGYEAKGGEEGQDMFGGGGMEDNSDQGSAPTMPTYGR